MKGNAASTSADAASRSKKRLLRRRGIEWSNPPQNTSQDGSATSRLTIPASRSKNVDRSDTHMPRCAQASVEHQHATLPCTDAEQADHQQAHRSHREEPQSKADRKDASADVGLRHEVIDHEQAD